MGAQAPTRPFPAPDSLSLARPFSVLLETEAVPCSTWAFFSSFSLIAFVIALQVWSIPVSIYVWSCHSQQLETRYQPTSAGQQSLNYPFWPQEGCTVYLTSESTLPSLLPNRIWALALPLKTRNGSCLQIHGDISTPPDSLKLLPLHQFPQPPNGQSSSCLCLTVGDGC